MSEWVPRVEGEGPILVAAWAEDFDCFYRMKTLEEANAFSDGYSTGANKYGCGKCTTIALVGAWEQELSAADVATVKDMLRRCGITL